MHFISCQTLWIQFTWRSQLSLANVKEAEDVTGPEKLNLEPTVATSHCTGQDTMISSSSNYVFASIPSPAPPNLIKTRSVSLVHITEISVCFFMLDCLYDAFSETDKFNQTHGV